MSQTKYSCSKNLPILEKLYQILNLSHNSGTLYFYSEHDLPRWKIRDRNDPPVLAIPCILQVQLLIFYLFFRNKYT